MLALAGLLLLSGCATGQNAFRQGNYTEAARTSADRLARSPQNKKAAEIFLNAYPQARAEWLERVRQASNDTTDPFRWERVLSAYEALQGLSNRAALTPFAGRNGIEVVYYHSEIESARATAANARIQYADERLATGDMYAAREAVEHYDAAMSFVGHRDDILQKRDVAHRLGTLLVGIDLVEGQGHSLNPSSMMSALVDELEKRRVHEFVAFVPTDELGDTKAVHYAQLSIGEVSVTRSEAEVSHQPFLKSLAPPKHNPDAKPIEVKATVIRREKKFVLSCPARLRVFAGPDGEAILNRELPGKTAWGAQWDIVHGDRRALEGVELQLTEPPDPEHATLMQILADAVAAQARDALAGFYKNG